MSSDRYNATEQPTIRRLNKAREEGQVARSNDLSSVLFLIVAVGVSIAWAPRLLLICKNILVDSLSFSKSNPQVALETTGWLLVEFLVVPCFVLFVGPSAIQACRPTVAPQRERAGVALGATRVRRG